MSRFRVLIVGSGLGGLSCAIACRQQGLEVDIVEKVPELKEIGAGIQMPPNAVRVMNHYGLVSKIEATGAIQLDVHNLLRYTDGKILSCRPGVDWLEKEFGHTWYTIHRVDYQRVLYEEAVRLGVNIRLNCEVEQVNSAAPSVTLHGGEQIHADVIIGADGLHSIMRTQLFGDVIRPEETGDLAYRAIIPRERIEELHDDSLSSFLEEDGMRLWLGPNAHAILYPVRNKSVFNLVLLRPDDLPPEIAIAKGDVEEMRAFFVDWDPRLRALLTCIDEVLKWRLSHMQELNTWVDGKVALLGDACHPTLPYQAQGAAMAVEDGAALGTILGLLVEREVSGGPPAKPSIPAALVLYEATRKKRSAANVKGAIENRRLYHMANGPECEERNKVLAEADFWDVNSKSPWGWTNLAYQKELMCHDTVQDAKERFKAWSKYS